MVFHINFIFCIDCVKAGGDKKHKDKKIRI